MKPGTIISQYEILSQLGGGGMGVVYTAQDTKLDRLVALKFLPPEVSRDENAKERFTQEAKAASALNHANICAIHDISETDDGQLFIVMAQYDGQTLKHRLADGPLDEGEAVRIARQLADGLSAAHDKGIVHRDIKPANIMITEKGRAVILDFGLAKLTGGIDLTKTGSTIGTTAYMSPEQARGDTVDQQTDVWSLGAVLYEMITGRKPFPGDYDQAVIYGILNTEPEPARSEEGGVRSEEGGEQLQRVISKALTKDRSRRYASADDLIVDLDAIEAGGVVAGPMRQPSRNLVYALLAAVVLLLVATLGILIPNQDAAVDSVAVLPLANLSGDADQEYLADGMTDALINELSKIGALKVISRQSVMRFKDSDLTLSEIADDLGVDAIVSGSVIRSGNDIRVSAQLVSAATDENMWADSYDEQFENVLVLHSQLARQIAEEIQVSLTPQEETLLATARTIDPEAYEAYLRGHHHLYKLSQADTETARDYFEQSLEIDSTYAEAYAGVATTWVVLQQMGAVSPAEAGPAIMGSLAKAMELDSTLADVHYTQGVIQTWGIWDFAAAEKSFLRALELNPNHAEVNAFMAHLLNIVRKDGGLDLSERSVELDPHNSFFRSLYGASLSQNRRFEEAIVQAQISQESAPRNFVNFEVMTFANVSLNRPDEAYEIQIDQWTVADDAEALAALREGYSSGGFVGAAHSLAELLAARSETSYVSPNLISWYYLFGGDQNRALDWLERGYDSHDPAMPYIGVLSTYDPLRGDPRFEELLVKMNLEMWADRPASGV